MVDGRHNPFPPAVLSRLAGTFRLDRMSTMRSSGVVACVSLYVCKLLMRARSGDHAQLRLQTRELICCM